MAYFFPPNRRCEDFPQIRICVIKLLLHNTNINTIKVPCSAYRQTIIVRRSLFLIFDRLYPGGTSFFLDKGSVLIVKMWSQLKKCSEVLSLVPLGFKTYFTKCHRGILGESLRQRMGVGPLLPEKDGLCIVSVIVF